MTMGQKLTVEDIISEAISEAWKEWEHRETDATVACLGVAAAAIETYTEIKRLEKEGY